MDLNKLSYQEDTWKLKCNVKKCKMQYIGSKNIKVEYKLSNREIKKINEEYDFGIRFNDTFKTDNHILSLVSRANEKIGWRLKYFKGGKCCFKNI